MTITTLLLLAQIAIGNLPTDTPVVTKTVQAAPTLGPTTDLTTALDGPMRVSLDLDRAVLTDPKTNITLELWVYNGIFYTLDASVVYVGGNYKFKNTGKVDLTQPGFWLDSAAYAGKKIRVRVVPNSGPVAAGAMLETTTK